MNDQITSSGRAAKPVRRRQARIRPLHHAQPPAADNIDSGAKRVVSTSVEPPRGRQGASLHADTRRHPPPADTSDDAVMAICLKLADHQKIRRFCIMAQSRCDRSMQTAIARSLGFTTAIADEGDRKALFKRAAAIMKAVEQGVPFDPPLPAGDPRLETLTSFLPLIPLSAASRAPWDEKREDTERIMRKLAQSLPVWPWVQANAKGVGDLGLARLVGEAPLIGIYSTHEKLWKRMGVAVLAGERQQRRSDPDEALLHGYAPARRAELWSVCSDTMLRSQWRGGGTDPETEEASAGYPVGAYGAVYQRRKAHTLARILDTEALPFTDRRKWTRQRCDRDARRVMSKEFLRDFWRVWRGLDARHPARWMATQKAAAAA